MILAKFEQIKQYICQQVELGHLQEHDRVPSENALSEQFVCSRMTARRAITELCDTGLLVRSQGRGTFVATLKSQTSLMEIRNISDEIRERGHDYSVEIISLKEVAATQDIAITLNVEKETIVYCSTLVHLEDALPVQLEVRFVNPRLVPDYLTNDFTLHTPHEFLSMAAPLTEAEHIIEAVMPTSLIAKQLKLAQYEPCLQIKRRTFSSKGVVSFATLTHPSSRFRIGGRFSVNNS